MDDAFDETLGTYASGEAVAAYALREASQPPGRDASCRGLLDGIGLRGLRVLDVGCGTGRDVAWFRSRGAEAFGADASAAMLTHAARTHGHPDWWVLSDMRRDRDTPWGGVSSVDVVWSMASLVHVPRAETGAILRRWASWLRPGGLVAVATKLGEGERVTSGLGPGLPRTMVYRSVDEVVDPLRGAGLAVERLVARKPSVDAASGEELFLVLARLPADAGDARVDATAAVW